MSRTTVIFMINAADMPQEMLDEPAELERARSVLIAFDADCPKATQERVMKFKRVNPTRRVAN